MSVLAKCAREFGRCCANHQPGQTESCFQPTLLFLPEAAKLKLIPTN